MIKKFLITLAVLALLAGTAQAGSLTDLQVGELAASTKGRVVISDGSVLLRIWCTDGTQYGKVGVSQSDVLYLTEVDGAVAASRMGITSSGYIDLSQTTADTVQELVDIINSDSEGIWKASLGPDAYGALDSSYMVTKTNAYIGSTETGDSDNDIKLSCTDADYITIGVSPDTNEIKRLKSLTHRISGSGSVRVSVYDGDTEIYRSYTTAAKYNDNSANYNIAASGNRVDFGSITDGKGLSSSRGNEICVVITRTSVGDDTASAAKLPNCNLSIQYDEVVR